MKKKKTMKWLAAILLMVAACMLIAGCGQQGKAPSSETGKKSEDSKFTDLVENVGSNIKAHWPYMEQVWPTHDYKKHNLVLFKLNQEEAVEEAWLLNAEKKKKLEPKDYEGITPPQAGGYSKIEIEGKPSIAMSLTEEDMKEADSAQQVYQVATHELVHFYHQKTGKESAEGSRTQEFPIVETPRLYRQMIYKNLISAYESPEQKDAHLAKAKYWLEKWKKEFPDEAQNIKTTDIVEGTARYIEYVGAFITKDMSKEEFRKEALKHIRKDERFTSAEAESYELGYVAGLLLDEKQPDWKKAFYEENVTLVDKLLENVTPQEEQMNPELEGAVRKKINEANKQTEEAIKSVIKAEGNKQIPYLKIEAGEDTSSFSSSGQYIYKGLEVITEFGNKYEVDGKKIEVDKQTVITQETETAGYTLVPLSMPYEIKDGILTVKSEGLTVEGVKVKTSTEDGRTIYSVKAK